jgi:hypothetical protein
MLNPNDTARARERISQSSDWDAAAAESGWFGCPLTFDEASGWEVVHEERPSADRYKFDPPAFIRGVPVDPSCLKGIGVPNLTTSTNIVYRARNVRVVGWQALLAETGSLHIGAVPVRHMSQFDRLLKQTNDGHHGFILLKTSSEEPKIFYRMAARPLCLAGVGACIGGLEPGNYGSFLFRMLLALLFLAECRLNIDYVIVPERTPWMMEALALTGFGRMPAFTIREAAGLVCQELYVATEFDSEAYIDEYSLRRLRDLAALCLSRNPDTRQPSERLYVSRALAAQRSAHYRRLINEEAVEAEARRRGFRILYPETHSFEQQIALFGAARQIAGPSGSGMLNAAFSPAGTTVIDLESFHYTVRQHAKLYASTEKKYGFVFGAPDAGPRPLHFRNWSVDLADFTAALDLMEA